MTEISFAKSFLATLDSYPTKLSPDHVESPKSYPVRPLLNLPKSSRPLPKKRKLTNGTTLNLTIRLRSFRNPPLDHTLSSQSPTTSILEIKETLSTLTNIPVKKIKLLFNKKPVSDSSDLKSLVSENDGVAEVTVELGVLVLGGAASLKGNSDTDAVKPENIITELKQGDALLESESFWLDLKEYLVKQLQDESAGERIWKVFQAAFRAEKQS